MIYECFFIVGEKLAVESLTHKLRMSIENKFLLSHVMICGATQVNGLFSSMETYRLRFLF